jgi:hypothetical protein
MQISALEQLAEKSKVFIQKRQNEWMVECVRRDEFGYPISRLKGGYN